MEDLISIVVPIYNVEKYIAKCIESIINQTYKNLEIILIDDGSKDSSGSICDKYAKKDSRIKIIHKQNEGVSETRNVGIKNASGKYIAFIDSDDYVDNTMYEKMLQTMKKENADIVLTSSCNVNKNIEIPTKLNEKKYKTKEDVINNMIGTAPENEKDIDLGFGIWKCLYNLDIIKKHNILFKSQKKYITEDILFQIEYFDYVTNVAIINEPLYKHRYNEHSLSNQYETNRLERQKIFYQKLRQMLEERNILTKDLENRLNRTFLMKVKACIKLEVFINKQSKKEKVQNINKMLKDELVTEILKKYPINKSNTKNKIYLLLMKYKKGKILYLIYQKRNKRRKN